MVKSSGDHFNRGIALVFFLATVVVVGIAFLMGEKGEPIQYVASQINGAPAQTEKLPEEQQKPLPPPPPTHIKTPEAVKGIYMTSWVASTNDWKNNLITFMDTSEVNAVVVDIKDYTGKVSFEVADEELKKVGSGTARIRDIRGFVNKLHEKNIYAIARIAVFQDPFYVKYNPEAAVKRTNGEIWRDRKGLPWVDPCDKDFWDYIIKISKETEAVGFDELNFDYIRFASDGKMDDISYTHCEPKVAKADLMERFFVYLQAGLKDVGVPLSVDLFGMVSTNKDDLGIGQVLEKAAPYFDYICPMVYPSHYPPGYNGYKNPNLYPYEVIKLAMDTASQRLTTASTTPLKLRPWLQDFKLGGVTYDSTMIRKEKKAVYDAGLTSWLMWDPANKYTRGAYDLAE